MQQRRKLNDIESNDPAAIGINDSSSHTVPPSASFASTSIAGRKRYQPKTGIDGKKTTDWNANLIIITLTVIVVVLPFYLYFLASFSNTSKSNTVDIIKTDAPILNDIMIDSSEKQDKLIEATDHKIDDNVHERAKTSEKGMMKERNPQIFVMGMHHSGTSLITKLIMMMGAYGGSPNQLEMLRGNPLKYFEYKPALELDKLAMNQGVEHVHGPEWLAYGYKWDNMDANAQKRFLDKAKIVIDELDKKSEEKTWVVKDPRLCLLAKQWLGFTQNPICVLVVRDPKALSTRMQGYNRPHFDLPHHHDEMRNNNDGFNDGVLTVQEWGHTWEEYTARSLEGCMKSNARIVIALHAELVKDPRSFSEKLFKDLYDAGATDLHRVDAQELTDILGQEEQFRKKAKENEKKFPVEDAEGKSILSPRSFKMFEALTQRDLSKITLNELSNYAWHSKSVKEIEDANVQKDLYLQLPKETRAPHREVYVTIVSDNSKGYLSGALVLARSISQFDQTRDMVAMITMEVTDPFVTKVLQKVGYKVVPVEKLPEAWYERHRSCNTFNEDQKRRWGRMFSKLQMWTFDYDKIAYSDADTMYLKPVDDYFYLPNDFYAERSPSHKGFNCGIMVLKPSKDHLNKMLELAKHGEPMVFFPRATVGCTEQELLNRYFHGEKMETKLNNTRHADYLSDRFTSPTGREELKKYGARIAHWLTTKCEKPWDTPLQALIPTDRSYNPDIIRGICDPEMYRLWHQHFWKLQDELQVYDMNDIADLPKGLRIRPTDEMLNTSLRKSRKREEESREDDSDSNRVSMKSNPRSKSGNRNVFKWGQVFGKQK